MRHVVLELRPDPFHSMWPRHVLSGWISSSQIPQIGNQFLLMSWTRLRFLTHFQCSQVVRSTFSCFLASKNQHHKAQNPVPPPKMRRSSMKIGRHEFISVRTDGVLMCVKTVACRDTISSTVNLIATAKIGCSARIKRRHLVIFARLDVCSMFY